MRKIILICLVVSFGWAKIDNCSFWINKSRSEANGLTISLGDKDIRGALSSCSSFTSYSKLMLQECGKGEDDLVLKYRTSMMKLCEEIKDKFYKDRFK